MKNKLITLMVLSILGTIGFIMTIAATANATTYTYSYYGGYNFTNTVWTDIWYGVFGVILMAGAFIAQFVLGIVVLSTKAKHNDQSGITTAAGVIGILGGIIFVGAIVSGIAASQAGKNSVSSIGYSHSNDVKHQESSDIETLKREIAELKKQGQNSGEQNS